jgi:L-phenylalanine/L-methionine N-acetyltransferase
MSQQEFEVRRARPEDADAFAELMNDPAVYPGVLQLPHTDAAFWRERLKEPGGPTVVDLHLVAVAEGKVIGSAGLHANAAVRRRHVMSLGMAVAGPWQGRGAGTALLSALCHQADNWLGILRIELTVYTDNTPAIALYRKLGFVKEGTHRGFAFRNGLYEDAHVMARLHPRPPYLEPRR